MTRRAAIIGAVVMALTVPATVSAKEDDASSPSQSFWQRRPPSAFRLKLELELGLLLTTVPIWAGINPNYFATPSCGSSTNPCDRNSVPAFDRSFIYANRAVFTASDIVFPYAMLVLGGVMFVDYGPHQWRSYLTDFTIVFESVALAASVTHIVRVSTRRERPYLYIEGAYPERRGTPDATMSFWSGHVSYTFAFGVSASYLITRRHGWRSGWTWGAWSTALVLGATTATLQVLDGEHFLSDVLIGAGFGAGIGLLVPLMHPRRLATNLNLAPVVAHDRNGDRYGVLLSGRF